MNALRVTVAAVILSAVLQSGRAAAQPEPVVLKGHTKAVTAVAWAADGKAMATAGDDRTVRIWDPATGRQTALLEGIAQEKYGGPVVAFTADLKLVAVNYWGELTIRAVADGKVLIKIDPILDRGQRSAFRPDVFALAFSPDGKRLATVGSTAAVGGPHGLPGGIAIVWDVESGKMIHKSDKLSTAASSVAWSSEGKRLATGTNGAGGELPEPGEVRVCDAESGKVLHSFKVKPEVAQGEWASAGDVAFAPDGKRVAAPVTAGSRGTPAGLLIDDTGASVQLWDLESGKSTQPVKGLKASVGRVAFSPDGKSLATAGTDKVVRVWDVETGKERLALPCPDRVAAVAFSPDGTSLAAASRDGTVRVWAMAAAKIKEQEAHLQNAKTGDLEKRPDDQKAGELKKLQGRWVVVRKTFEGRPQNGLLLGFTLQDNFDIDVTSRPKRLYLDTIGVDLKPKKTSYIYTFDDDHLLVGEDWWGSKPPLDFGSVSGEFWRLEREPKNVVPAAAGEPQPPHDDAAELAAKLKQLQEQLKAAKAKELERRFKGDDLKELKRLQGKWTVVRANADGHPQGERGQYTFDGDTLTNPSGFKGTITIHTTARPRSFTWASPTADGGRDSAWYIYAFDDDQLLLSTSTLVRPTGPLADFSSGYLLRLERAKE